ncbi:hypothetical protein, partial [Halomonas colorata]
QLVHPLQKEFAASLSLFVLVLGFGEGDLIHGSTEPYAVDDVRIIAEGRDFFRASLAEQAMPEGRPRAAFCYLGV